ncbi:MAG: serine/threonine protein phosphatase, partial [Sulfitobacter sp.]|nr:serine/threonine protein phosphatase [Sulfitobacter sp.]
MIKRLASHFRHWSRRTDASGIDAQSTLAPDAPFVAVGDVHGCHDALRALMTRMDRIAEGSETVIFVGDYIDRGPESRQVLTWLYELNQAYPEKAHCLMGNHERMMLDFIDDPVGRGEIWLRNGGLETLASFGVTLSRAEADTEVAVGVANALEAALPAGMLAWLRDLPLVWSSGNVHCTHAAMSPRRAPEEQ